MTRATSSRAPPSLPALPSRLARALLVAALLAPLATAAPVIHGTLQAQGTVSHFQFLPAAGLALEGGPYEWTRACSECLLRVTITGGSWIHYDASQGPVFLAPGVYELREFRGLFFGNDVALRHFEVQVHGLAKVVPIPARP